MRFRDMFGEWDIDRLRIKIFQVFSAIGEGTRYIRPTRLLVLFGAMLIVLLAVGGYLYLEQTQDKLTKKDWVLLLAGTAVSIFALVVGITYSRGTTRDELLDQVETYHTVKRVLGIKSLGPLWRDPPNHHAEGMSTGFYFMGVGGGKFLEDTFKNNVLVANEESDNVRILLVDPRSPALSRLSKTKKLHESLSAEVDKTLRFLAHKQADGFKFQVKLLREIPPLRLHIVDNKRVSVTGYYKSHSGWHSPQFVFDDVSAFSLVDAYKDLFKFYWDNSIPISLQRYVESMVARDEDLVDYGMAHGRFQPFHLEHLEYVLRVARRTKKRCYVGITNPDGNDQAEETSSHRHEPLANPFSFAERKRMIIDSVRIAAPDLADRIECVPFNVRSPNDLQLPTGKPVQFVRIFGEWERKKIADFTAAGFEVRILDENSIKLMEGTEVRFLIRAARNWHQLVPFGTEKVIKDRLDNRKQI